MADCEFPENEGIHGKCKESAASSTAHTSSYCSCHELECKGSNLGTGKGETFREEILLSQH